MRLFLWIVVVGYFILMAPHQAYAQPDLQKRVDELGKRVDELEWKGPTQIAGPFLFLFGAFCALWAQNTQRSPWLWFLLGVFFHVIAVLVLLAKNGDDQKRLRGEPVTAPTWGLTLAIVGGLLILAAALMFILWSLGWMG